MASNPNTLTASIAKYLSKRLQRKLYKTTLFRQQTSMEDKPTLKKGNTVDRPYSSDLEVNDMGNDGSYTRQTIEDTEQVLVINKEKEVSFYVKSLDELQNNYKVRNERSDQAGMRLGEQIDGDVLGEYDQASSTVDMGDIGGTAGQGITLSTSNIIKVLSAVGMKMTRLSVIRSDRWGDVSAEFENILWQLLGDKESDRGDQVGEFGFIKKHAGFNLNASNALGWSGTLLVGTNPTADDTVVINGVTFTFKAVPSLAGEVDIGSDAAGSVDNLVAAINNSGSYAAGEGVNTSYFEVSAANRKLLKNIVATDATTSITIKATGHSYVVVSETLTAAGDIWTTTKQIQHCLFGQAKPIDLVIQKEAESLVKDRDGKVGKDIVLWTAYGYKTFNEGKDRLVDVHLRSDAY